ncbi:hypothetical protein [Candidatus Poriferisodalis sp.]|uniref:hypothetical protein n=1 Tax=Candidatus Poriferisodalis sp. TaxID=3101277 RepID=UPI003B5AE9D7
MAERPPVADWATDFDDLSDEWATNGPEILADLREHCPVAQTERFHGPLCQSRARGGRVAGRPDSRPPQRAAASPEVSR